jgi:hypothetical protein
MHLVVYFAKLKGKINNMGLKKKSWISIVIHLQILQDRPMDNT